MRDKKMKGLALLLSLTMMLTPVLGVSAETEDGTVVEMVAEEVEEETAKETEEAEETSEEEEADEAETSEAAEETEEAEKAAEETAEEEKAEEAPETGAVYTESTPKDGEYEVVPTSDSAMFKVVKCTIKVKDGRCTAVVSLSGTGYDKLYLGDEKEAEANEAAAISYYNLDGKYTFDLPGVALDTPVTVAAHAVKSNTWKNRVLTFPSATVETEDTTVETPESENVEDTDDESTPVVDNSTTLPDGTYAPDNFSFTGGTGRVKITCAEIKVEDGKSYATIKFSSKNYTQLKANARVYSATVSDGSYFTIPVKLNADNPVRGLTTTMSEPHWVAYAVLPVLSLPKPVPTEVPDPTPTDVPEPAPTEVPEPTPTEAPENPLVVDGVAKDGTYTVEAPTTTGKMFRVIAAALTSKDGKMTAKITLSGEGYDRLYLGTPEDAAAGEAGWINYTKDEQGQYVFEVPVEALDQEVLLAVHAVKSDAWSVRGITFNSATLVEISSDDEDPQEPTPSPAPSTTPTPSPTPKPAEKDLSGSTSAVNSATGLADGVYTPDKFSWSGGTGRVNITCPQVTVKGGQALATIVFSSPNYGYVKASGSVYYPSVSGRTSSFTIPVELNANNTIIGMTTAMSQPYEITYSIYVYIAKAGETAAKPLDNNTLSDKAPEIAGLTAGTEIPMEHARLVKMYQYDQGITLVEVDLATGTDKPDTDDTDKEATDAQTLISDLYKNKVVRYLLVPENAEIPVGLEKEIVVIHLPVKKAFTDSEDLIAALDFLELGDVLAVRGEEGELPPYQDIVLDEVDFAVLGSDYLWDATKDESLEEQSERFYDVTERLTTLGIPAFIDRNADEADDNASLEWAKIYGKLFGCEDEMEKLYKAGLEALSEDAD